MISTDLYLAFVLASVLLALLPGPNVALIVGNSVAWGSRYGFLTVLGTTSAMLPQLALTGLGMTAALETFGQWFAVVRWVGAAYLVYLGLRTFLATPADLGSIRAQPKSAKLIWGRAFLVSLSNPKTLFFFGAFFPQFLDPLRPVLAQIVLLAVTFVTIAFTVDCGWAYLAGRARVVLTRRARLRNRISGGLLVGAGLGLALARGK